MFLQSFEEYLLKEFGDDAIEKYWSDKNDIDPSSIGYTSDKEVWIKCQKTDYHEDYLITPHHFSQGHRCPYCSGRKLHIKDSFYQWCIDNDKKDLLDRWDYELNDKLPTEYRYTSRYKVWMKCPRGLHESTQFTIRVMTSSKNVSCAKCKSVGQYLLDLYGYDGIKMYWSDKNTIDPFDISIESNKKAWFKCQEVSYHPDYEMRLADFKNKHRCPYCYNRKTCREDSFGQWGMDNIDEDFINKYWSEKNIKDPFAIAKRSSNTNIWMKCQNNSNHKDYKTIPDRFYDGARCPYCSHNLISKEDSLGAQYPDLINIWSEKNTEDIFEVAIYSKNKYWFCCEKHGDYQTYPRVVVDSYYKCPKCSLENISRYQDMTMKYLDEKGITYLNEYNCNLKCINPKTGYQLPYDNELPDYKLIIEVNGAQHYNPNKQWFINRSKSNMQEEFEYQKWKDEFKRNYALEHGYFYLEIPYWNFRTDYYKKVIDKKLNEIINNTPTTTKRDNSIAS